MCTGPRQHGAGAPRYGHLSAAGEPVGIRLIKWVLDEAPDDLSPLEYLTLVALAEWARDETGQCWPGRAALGRRIRRSSSTVDRMMRSLIGRGLIEIVKPAAPGRTPVYQLNVRHLVTHERKSSSDARSGSTCVTLGGNVRHFEAQRASSGDAQNPQEPSREPSNTRASDPSRNGKPGPGWLDGTVNFVAERLTATTGKTYDRRDVADSVTGFLRGKQVTNPSAYIHKCATENPFQLEPTPAPKRYRKEDHQ